MYRHSVNQYGQAIQAWLRNWPRPVCGTRLSDRSRRQTERCSCVGASRVNLCFPISVIKAVLTVNDDQIHGIFTLACRKALPEFDIVVVPLQVDVRTYFIGNPGNAIPLCKPHWAALRTLHAYISRDWGFNTPELFEWA